MICVSALEQRLKLLQNGKRIVQRLDREEQNTDTKINEIHRSLFGRGSFMVSCGLVYSEPPETNRQKEIREQKEKLYDQMVEPYAKKLKEITKQRKQNLQIMRIKQKYDRDGYEITTWFIDNRIKELKQLLKEA